MKIKIFIWALVFLFFFPAIYGEESSIPEDEELKELLLKQFPPSTHIQAGQAVGASIKTLMIGMTKYDPPDNAEWDLYHFYDSYSDYSPDRWIGFVVVNYGNNDVNIKVQMEMCYGDGKTLWRKKWNKNIQENRAVLYYVKTTKPNKVGLYALKGKIYGAEGLGHNNEVSTNYYIYEVW